MSPEKMLATTLKLGIEEYLEGERRAANQILVASSKYPGGQEMQSSMSRQQGAGLMEQGGN